MLIDISIPYWARWIAQNADSEVWLFTHKPKKDKEFGVWYLVKGDCELLAHAATPPPTGRKLCRGLRDD